jgi:hypothetical protein
VRIVANDTVGTADTQKILCNTPRQVVDGTWITADTLPLICAL